MDTRTTPAFRFATVALAFFLTFPACQMTPPPVMPRLATAEVSNDFDSYEIRRVGLLPFQGRTRAGELHTNLQDAFRFEVSRSTPYEIVLLDPNDLEMVEASDPHLRGWYRPETMIAIAKRFNVDAVLFGTVTAERFFPPQLLSLSVDLVSTETGLVVWNASIHLDANDARVVEGLHAYYEDVDSPEQWKLSLISPERFARFAAFQVAAML